MKIIINKFRWNVVKKTDDQYVLQKPETVENDEKTFENSLECWNEWTSMSVPAGMRYGGYVDNKDSIVIQYFGVDGGVNFTLKKWDTFDKDVVKHYGIKQVLYTNAEDAKSQFPSMKQTNEMWFMDEKSWKEQVEKMEPDFVWEDDPVLPFVYGRYTSKNGIVASIAYSYEAENGKN